MLPGLWSHNDSPHVALLLQTTIGLLLLGQKKKWLQNLDGSTMAAPRGPLVLLLVDHLRADGGLLAGNIMTIAISQANIGL